MTYKFFKYNLSKDNRATPIFSLHLRNHQPGSQNSILIRKPPQAEGVNISIVC